MAHTTITLYAKGCEFDLIAEGHVATGGSNSYGSDEPAWVEVEDVTLYRENGKPISQRLEKHLLQEHGEYIGEKLIEAEW